MPSPISNDVHNCDTDSDDESEQGVNGLTAYIPDTTPSLVELGPEDFPLHFSERDGRLFHSHNTSPYPLPVDTPEQERLNVIHDILHQLIGANYVGPVADVLAGGRQKLALDLCTGTGKWVIDMAGEFPDVEFRGIDIVPIATRYPPPNVQFEIHDVNDTYRWRTASVDLVHARSVSMAYSTYRREFQQVLDYSAVLQEVGRVLKPGGLLTWCEWARSPTFHPHFYPSLGPDLQVHAPGLCHFFDVLARALDTCRGIQPVTAALPGLIAEAGCFVDITPMVYYVPIGPWHSEPVMKALGRAFRAIMVRYADSTKPLLTEAGCTPQQIDAIVEGYMDDLMTIRGLSAVYHTVHARRAE
ncbi:hypothetical protein H0H92_013819 [Tricholoma furcatifolium]|nr:hypothetical protein H0H92_013819 [Tricholoma furcatifolium]